MITSCILVNKSIELLRQEISNLEIEINDINSAIISLQENLQNATTSEKGDIIKQIRLSQDKLHDLKFSLNQKNNTLNDSLNQLNFCFDYIRIHAIICSDDLDPNNPSTNLRRADINYNELKLWIDRTNQLYAQVHIFFLFDQNSDITEINNTKINNYACDGNLDNIRDCNVCPTSEEEANRIADQYPGKLVIFFRHGPGADPIGGGCSNPKPPNELPFTKFVMMPGFKSTSVCGIQNINLLAHEIGHFFGLTHTHNYISGTIDDASNLYILSGKNKDIFDYDKTSIGISDTDPDPFIRYNYTNNIDDLTSFSNFPCNRGLTQVLLPLGDPNADTFILPRNNIMSYYPDVSYFSPQQIAYIRNHLASRGIAVLPSNNINILSHENYE